MDHKQVLAFTTVHISSYFLRWGTWSLWAKGNEWIQSCWHTLSNAPHIAGCLRALQHDTRAAFNTSRAGPGSSFRSQIISLETSVPLSTWASLLEHVCTWKCFPWVCLAAILPHVCTVLTWTSPFFNFSCLVVGTELNTRNQRFQQLLGILSVLTGLEGSGSLSESPRATVFLRTGFL